MARNQSPMVLNLHLSRSDDSTEDEMEQLHVRVPSDSMNTTIKKIRDGTTPTQLKSKKRIKENKSIRDWWNWYTQNPIQRLPFVYFMALIIATPILSTFWFMDNDSCFIVTGAIGLFMTAYAIHKFRTLIALKKQINEYRDLNLKFKKDNIALKSAIQRVLNASKELKQTQRRITVANARNKDNLQLFSQIEANMKIAGQKNIAGMTGVYKRASEMKESWRMELLTSERDMLNSAYQRFEQTGVRQDGVTREEFNALARMLPKTYRKRFARMGTFSTFAQGGTVLDFDKFSNAIDLYATMEIDNVDLDPTPFVTPEITPLGTPFHSPFSAFSQLGNLSDLGLHSMVMSDNTFGHFRLGLHSSVKSSSMSSNNSNSNDNTMIYNNHHLLSPSGHTEKKFLLPQAPQ